MFACIQVVLTLVLLFALHQTAFISLFHTNIVLLFAAFFIGTESKMKLWDVLATCLLLLSSVATRPLYQNTQPAKRTYLPSSYTDTASVSEEDKEPSFQRKNYNLQEISMEDQCKAHKHVVSSGVASWDIAGDTSTVGRWIS